MTEKQKKLIEKTFGAIGYLSLVVALGIITLVAAWTITDGLGFDAVLDALLYETFMVFLPSIAVSVVAFWIRAFLRAGTDNK
jgi:hypothetical protein